MAKKLNTKQKSNNKNKLPIKEISSVDTSTGVTPLFDTPLAEKEKNLSKDNRVGMTFEVSSDFRSEYKVFAIRRNMTMGEMFQEAFELYKKVYPLKSKDK